MQKDNSQIDQPHDKDQLTCTICTHEYNMNRKLPIKACKNNHTFCLYCIIQSVQLFKPSCPYCRQNLEPRQKNEQMCYRVLQKYKNKFNILGQKGMKRQKLKLKFGKFGQKLLSIDFFQFAPRNGPITKIKANRFPSMLIFQPQIKQNSKTNYQAVFTYFPKSQVKISFGICVFDKFLQKIVQNIGFDTQIIQFFSQKIDKQQANNNKRLKIILHIDLDSKMISWVQQKEQTKQMLSLLCRQPLEKPQKVGQLVYYCYITLYLVNDQILLNK